GHGHGTVHGAGTQAHPLGQTHGEIDRDVVVPRRRRPVVLPRAAASAPAGPNGANRDAVGDLHGLDVDAVGVGSVVRLHRDDLQRLACRRFDLHGADGVADPHPVLRRDLRAIPPGVRGVARPRVGVRVKIEMAREDLQLLQPPQALQGDGKVFGEALAGPRDDVPYAQADRDHAAKQHDAADDLLTPRVPERVHARSPPRAGPATILARRTRIREVLFRERRGGETTHPGGLGPPGGIPGTASLYAAGPETPHGGAVE